MNPSEPVPQSTAGCTPVVIVPGSSPTFHSCRLSDSEDLKRLRDDWARLATDSGYPFHSWQWLENWWRFYQDESRELSLLVAKNQRDEVVGLLPMYLHQQRLGRRVLRFLGGDDVCTDYNTMLASDDDRAAVAASFAELIFSGGLPAFDQIELDSVHPSDANINSLIGALVEVDFDVDRRTALGCWRVELDEDWDKYLATLSKSRRWRTRKLFRDYIETGRTTIHYADSDESYEHGFKILVELHQDRRNSLGQPGCFQSEAFTKFLHAAGKDFLHSGQLSLQWIELEGQPVAAEFDLRGNDTVFYYQSGFSTAQEEHRPGWQGVMSALRRASEDGVRYFDFLRGDEPYKASWGAERVEQETIILTAPRLRSQIHQWADKSINQIRDVGKKLSGRG